MSTDRGDEWSWPTVAAVEANACDRRGSVDEFEERRHRDIFPLFSPAPAKVAGWDGLSRGVRQRVGRRLAWQEWCSRGVDTLNFLAGGHAFVEEGKRLSGPQSLAQKVAFDGISSCYRDFPSPPVGKRCEESLREILACGPGYSQVPGIVQPYGRTRVSWPEVGDAPAPLLELLPASEAQCVRSWRERMLLSSDEIAVAVAKAGVKQPYMDPLLKRRPRAYAEFLLRLSSCGMIRWERAAGRRGNVGAFFVLKSSGKLRLVLDTRVANCSFKKPPATRLPTASAWSHVKPASKTAACSWPAVT